MQERFDKLIVTAITPERHGQTCGYWYVVQNNLTAHTAFTTLRGLHRWAEERGLKIESAIVERSGDSSKIIGAYERESHLSYDEFYSLPYILTTKTLSNGSYTLALITENEEGIRCVHTLNPNCRFRQEYDYPSASLEMK